MIFLNKDDKANLMDREVLNRKHKKNKSREGFNFVGSQYKWTDIDEQKMIANKIEEVTGEKK